VGRLESGVKFLKREVKVDGVRLVALYLGLENASMLLVSEQSGRLGTLALSMPETMHGVPYSTVILGERFGDIAQMMAEHLSRKTGKISLFSINLKTITADKIAKRLLQLIEMFVEEG